MEAKINIAEILRNKPRGIKLYSPIFGDCTYCYIHSESSDICVKRQYNVISYFNFEGLYNTAGECLLFPSKEMRDWSKFAWKKGDVLVGVGQRIIFEKFIDENYTEFQGKYSLSTYEDRTLVVDKICYTSYFRKLNDNVNVENYFKEIEERLGDKLNRETLKVEKTQPEFKDGDIVFVESHMFGINTSSIITAFRKEKENDKYKFSPALCESNVHDTYLRESPVVLSPSDIETLRLATKVEKQQLFSALEKEGKAWDAEKKQIIDLKPKVKFKPFDKIVGFEELGRGEWVCDMFSHYAKDDGRDVIIGIGGLTYLKALPFNKETAKLIGTTNDWEGGER